MVPTTVERLREGQGALERVLRSIKMERVYRRSDGSAEKESGTTPPPAGQKGEGILWMDVNLRLLVLCFELTCFLCPQMQIGMRCRQRPRLPP